MKILTRDELKIIIDESKWDQLIDVPETIWFECKREPYNFRSKIKIQEYAKDISGMANSEGGFIIIGFQTIQDKNSRVDKVDNFRPFTQKLIDINQYKSILDEWVYPKIDGIIFEWKKFNDEQGFLVICVPNNIIEKPFLVTKTVEENSKINGVVFGYFKRNDDRVNHFSVYKLQSLIKDGFRYNKFDNRLQNIESMLYGQMNSNNDVSVINDIEERIKNAQIECELIDKPNFILSCYPISPLNVTNLFSSRKSAILKLLNNPPDLRYGGWDLDINNSFEIFEGKYRKAVVPGVKSLEMWKDGTIIFNVTAGQSYLSWGNYSIEDSNYKINSIALVESTLLFTKLCSQIYNSIELEEPTFNYIISLNNVNSDNDSFYLPNSTFRYTGINKYAPSNNFLAKLGPFDLNKKYQSITYQLICSVYEWFGIEHDYIPFVNKELDEIDEQKIIDLK